MGLLRRLKRGTAVVIGGPCTIECLCGAGLEVLISSDKRHRIATHKMDERRVRALRRRNRRGARADKLDNDPPGAP